MAESYAQKNGIYPTLPSDETDNRDPNGINKHLQLNFSNVIAEPDRSAYNFELLHNVSNKVYQYSKLFMYRLLTILVGLPLMLVWGLVFGVYTFVMVWIGTPMRRLTQSVIAEFGIYIQTISDAVIAPIYRSVGQIWSNVRVTVNSQQINSIQQIQV